MAFGKRAETLKRPFGVQAQRVFLEQLAQSSNVTASAKMAGFTTGPVYDLRKKSPEFCARWHAALCEGYVRLEADLLAEALRSSAPNLKDITLKQRQMKTRLGLSLLAAHRLAVRGHDSSGPTSSRDPKEVRARLEKRFAEIRNRLGGDDDPAF
ncbi:MAG: hypothetical protein RL481_2101 [Pseudomonadota bacterium]